MMRAVRHQSHKLHFNRVTGATALFDLGTDPGEHADVAVGQPKIATELRHELDRFRAQKPATGDAVTMSPEQIQRLKNLGYLQ